MTIKLREIKRAYQEAVGSCVPSSRERCPPMEDIFASFEPRASKRSKNAIADHVSRCRPCFEEFQALLPVFLQKQRTLDDICRLIVPVPKERRPRHDTSSWHLWKSNLKKKVPRKTLLIAAPAFLASLLVLMLIFDNPVSISKARDQKERSVPAGEWSLLFPTDGKDCARSTLIFKWTPLREADYYVVELFDDALSPLWRSPCLFEPSLILPPEVAQGLLPGAKYFWIVTSRNSNGGRMESPIGHFTLR